MGTPLVTVIVLNYNGAHRLPGTLQALTKQDLPPGAWQTWVVDNASHDDSLAMLARDWPEVRVLANKQNLGFAGGNNTALREVTTPFAVLLNDDAVPEPDWLRHLIAPMQAAGRERVAATTSKLVFAPRFLSLRLETPGFRAPADPRELGAMISKVELLHQGRCDDVTNQVGWERCAFGPETVGGQQFRWTRPEGSMLVPIPGASGQELLGEVRLRITARAECSKPLTLSWEQGADTVQLDVDQAPLDVVVPSGTVLVDVINNVGSVLHAPGYGADRGYQEVDAGKYDHLEEVALFCGAAVCLRMSALKEVGILDDDFFMYYEDTDLSLRLLAAGWSILFVPGAVVRHEHSASSVEWSPFFTFHVERNRLLMLTKNLPARQAAGQVLRFQLTTVSMLRWAILQGVRDGRRPAVRPLVLRGRITASYLRLLPRALQRRRALSGKNQMTPEQLIERWLLPAKPSL